MVSVARTNIDIDEDLIAEAMRRYGLHSKRAAVDLALRRLIGEAMSRDDALAMEASGWTGDLANCAAPPRSKRDAGRHFRVGRVPPSDR